MSAWEIRVPVLHRRGLGRYFFEIEFPLRLRTANGWCETPFLFDSGTQLTTFPVSLAQRFAVPFHQSRPVNVRGTTGLARGFVSPLQYSFVSLRQLQFRTDCCFSSAKGERSLLSLTDLHRNFAMQTLPPSHLHPLGSVVLRLRDDHQGQLIH